LQVAGSLGQTAGFIGIAGVAVANVSHEFRTLLTLMFSPIEDLLDTELSPSSKGQLEIVHRISLRLLKLVNTLLDFSRIEAGRRRANYEERPTSQCTRRSWPATSGPPANALGSHSRSSARRGR
jgi:signal transduction histidine kinase